MKVNMPKDYKREMTIHQVEVAKKVIKWMKDEDESTPADYLKMAVNHIIAKSDIGDGIREVLSASAEVRTNRVWDRMFDGSEDIDILIEGFVRTYDGVVYVIAMLSDIWEIGSDTDIRNRIYYKYYAEAGWK